MNQISSRRPLGVEQGRNVHKASRADSKRCPFSVVVFIVGGGGGGGGN